MTEIIQGIKEREEALLHQWRNQTAGHLGHAIAQDEHWLDHPSPEKSEQSRGPVTQATEE